MAGISFGNEADSVWIVAGWAFRQALKDLTPQGRGDKGFLDALAAARHIGFLDVQTLDDRLKGRVTGAIENMCRGMLDGTYSSSIQESFPDIETQEAYRDGIRLLLSTVQASRKQRTD